MKNADTNKVIHYCWFGKNPLSKMAQKCIKSWMKYLPDYKIIEWNETNFDVNICPFVKQAYEKKKWAFVSDYARMYALYNYGGIYFDTDMELLKNIDNLKKDDIFLGYEENKKIAACVIGVKEKNNKYIKEILDYYDSLEEFDEDAVFQFAIPNILTREFNKYEKKTVNGVDVFDNSIYVYPEEYFYPINYNYSKKIYTDNTCMVHYYSASWVPKGEKVAAAVYRRFGKKYGSIILKIYYYLCNLKNSLIGKVKRVLSKIRYHFIKERVLNEKVEKVKKQLQKNQGDYIVITHPNWIGVGNVAKDNYKNILKLEEIKTEEEGKRYAEAINSYGYKTVVFNGMAIGWNNVAKELKQINPNFVIKLIWHGSHALLSEWYDWSMFKEMHSLYKEGIISEIGFVKKSMYDFYKEKGYNVSFLMNSVEILNKDRFKVCKNGNVTKIGLYASGGRWVKNFYNQVSAISLVENAVLDCIPLTEDVRFFSENFGLNITGKSSNIPREELLKRMSSNDINVYVTFTECAPLLPLESLELGVPCITGNNHHYFEGTELEKYLVVNKVDNIMEIYNKIEVALNNKDRIIELYNEWKQQYNIQAKNSMINFIKN